MSSPKNKCKQSEKKKKTYVAGMDRGAKGKQCWDNTAPEYPEKNVSKEKKTK